MKLKKNKTYEINPFLIKILGKQFCTATCRLQILTRKNDLQASSKYWTFWIQPLPKGFISFFSDLFPEGNGGKIWTRTPGTLFFVISNLIFLKMLNKKFVQNKYNTRLNLIRQDIFKKFSKNVTFTKFEAKADILLQTCNSDK